MQSRARLPGNGGALGGGTDRHATKTVGSSEEGKEQLGPLGKAPEISSFLIVELEDNFIYFL